VFGPVEAIEAIIDAARNAQVASAGPAPGFVR
jgi:hypothetical protein